MKAPSFSLPDQNNRTVTLSSFSGKKIVLYFYPKADTPGCTAQACGMRDNSSLIRKMGAEIIGISPDDVPDLTKFKQKYHINFTLLADPDLKAIKSYGVWQEKTFMGRRYMGVARTTFIINEKGNITHTFEKVNPLTHAENIIAALKESVAISQNYTQNTSQMSSQAFSKSSSEPNSVTIASKNPLKSEKINKSTAKNQKNLLNSQKKKKSTKKNVSKAKKSSSIVKKSVKKFVKSKKINKKSVSKKKK